MGPLETVSGAVARFAPRTTTVDGKECAPSEVDDWSAVIGKFKNGATGVWEGSTLMKGYHFDGFGKEWAEVNGSIASAVYQLTEPNTVRRLLSLQVHWLRLQCFLTAHMPP